MLIVIFKTIGVYIYLLLTMDTTTLTYGDIGTQINDVGTYNCQIFRNVRI